ncbi:hypothetical protein ABZV29_41220 [Streptomyces sp. NPDC005236]
MPPAVSLGEPLDRYAAWSEAELADQVVVRMRPERWSGGDLGSIG